MTTHSNLHFTSIDHEILRLGLAQLSFTERQILTYRFWDDSTIEEISEILEMSWTEVDQTIDSSIIKLKQLCLNHEEFSLYQQNDLKEDSM